MRENHVSTLGLRVLNLHILVTFTGKIDLWESGGSTSSEASYLKEAGSHFSSFSELLGAGSALLLKRASLITRPNNVGMW